MDAQKFGSFLQTQRKQLNLTQSQLAEKLHVTDKAVSRWERGVGLPDIQLLEPLAEVLQLSLTELIRSEKVDADMVPRAAADAALVEVLSLSENRWRRARSWLCGFLVWAVEVFLLSVINWFVDVTWVRLVSVFLILQSGSMINRLTQALLHPEKVRKKKSWKFQLKILILTIALLLYPLILLQQPYIGLEACGDLTLLLTVLLIAWGLWEVHRYVESMPDGTETNDQGS